MQGSSGRGHLSHPAWRHTHWCSTASRTQTPSPTLTWCSSSSTACPAAVAVSTLWSSTQPTPPECVSHSGLCCYLAQLWQAASHQTVTGFHLLSHASGMHTCIIRCSQSRPRQLVSASATDQSHSAQQCWRPAHSSGGGQRRAVRDVRTLKRDRRAVLCYGG